MNTYDKSSLVLIPSGIKDGKIYSQRPENGSGDFTFSRSTAATRVGPSGYIEKETQNLLTYSNDFGNSDWVNYQTTRTSGQSGYDGSSDAWLFTKNAQGFANIRNVITGVSGIYTYSVYLKAGTNSSAILRGLGTSSHSLGVNLSNGTSLFTDNLIDSNIEDVGNDWYRCSITFNANNVSNFYIYGEYPFNSATAGNIYIQDAQLEQGLVARDYIETTTSAVYGGITDNIPRLDYNGSCPSLLLEPQRTNVLSHSEYILSWAFDSVTATANYGTSPEGLQNSTRLLFSGASQEARLGATPTTGCVASIYVKGISGETIKFGSTGAEEVFTLNGSWQRLEKYNSGSANKITINTYGFATARDIEVWGAQLEQGSYATSYIPTYGSAVTQNNDVCASITTAGDNGLINDYQTSIFIDLAEVISDSDVIRFVTLTALGGAQNPRVLLYANSIQILVQYRVSGQSDVQIASSYIRANQNKALLRLNDTSLALFHNGVKINEVTIVKGDDIENLLLAEASSLDSGYKVNKLLSFPIALTDEEAIALTTI